jgi:hypothetical protein
MLQSPDEATDRIERGPASTLVERAGIDAAHGQHPGARWDGTS